METSIRSIGVAERGLDEPGAGLWRGRRQRDGGPGVVGGGGGVWGGSERGELSGERGPERGGGRRQGKGPETGGRGVGPGGGGGMEFLKGYHVWPSRKKLI